MASFSQDARTFLAQGAHRAYHGRGAVRDGKADTGARGSDGQGGGAQGGVAPGRGRAADEGARGADQGVNLFGKVVSTVIAQKDGVVVPTAARTVAPSATPTAAPSSPQSVSASTGGDGGNGGAATDGGSGGAGGRGGDAVLVPSPAARFV